jgi:DNA polymerase-3 subunit gamma/tau
VKSLYREYRPKNFAEVVGQNHITQTLQNQIRGDRISHAYLFCGTRGTGKTSVAKILAKTLTEDIDTFEIDAASNNSVTDVRDIVDRVKYPPVAGKYKVYIIDEVHMFSQSAFNAILKTLEEPPAHVVFILCTTEPHKLLPTVQSRCLRFDFRAVGTEVIEKLISKIFKKENVSASAEAVKLLAEAGCGSVRDALSYAESAINFAGGKEITGGVVAEILGTVGAGELKSLLSQIKNGDGKAITKSVDKIFAAGINTNMLVKNFIDIVKDEFVNAPETKIAGIFKTFCELEILIKNSPDARGHFENACLVASIGA